MTFNGNISGLLAGMASVLEVEDEPEETDAFNSLHEHARLEELVRRNTLCLPHLRSVYPLEVFSTDEEVGGLSKDVSRSSSMVEGHRRDPSGSSIGGGAASKESLSSSATSLPASQEIVKHKVNIVVYRYGNDCHGNRCHWVTLNNASDYRAISDP